jgi:hypothetical protein
MPRGRPTKRTLVNPQPGGCAAAVAASPPWRGRCKRRPLASRRRKEGSRRRGSHTSHAGAPSPQEAPPVAPTQLPLTPLQTPQTIPSGSSVAVLTPPTATAADSGADAGPSGKRVRWGLAPYARPTAAESSSLWLNRCRLGGILHELARAHRWRDAASVVSTLLRSSPKPVGSFQETRSLFVVGLLEPIP